MKKVTIGLVILLVVANCGSYNNNWTPPNQDQPNPQTTKGPYGKDDFNEADFKKYNFVLLQDLLFTSGEESETSGLFGTVKTLNLAYRNQVKTTGSDIDKNVSGCALAIQKNDDSATWNTLPQGKFIQSQITHSFDNGNHYLSIGMSQTSTFRQAFLTCKNALNSNDILTHLGNLIQLQAK